jgi:hypothetical protein
MKKILIVLGLMLSSAIFSQHTFWFNKISETELSVYTEAKYSSLNTVEDYLHSFESKYGKIELNNVLHEIQYRNTDNYCDQLKMNGYADEASAIGLMVTIFNEDKLCFVTDNKVYVLTYEPINLDFKNSKFADGERFEVGEKNLYLYRRDADGWRKASKLIRKDYHHDRIATREFDPHTKYLKGTNNKFNLENLYFGSIDWLSNGCVFITFSTTTYDRTEGYKSFNSILVFVPVSDGYYSCTYFEPVNKEGKIIKNVPIDVYDWNKSKWHQQITDINVPVLYGLKSIEYSGSSDGIPEQYENERSETPIQNKLTIKYIDGSESNSKEAGILNFKILNNHVSYSGTIGLTEIK